MAVNVGSAVAYLELDTSKFSKGFQSAINDLKVFGDKTATAEQKMKGLESGLKGAGSTLTKSVTVPLVGVGTAAVKVATDFEKQMSSVKAISSATGKEFEALQETAINLGASTSFSASEVAAAMTEMAKAGWDSQQIIDGMSGVLDAAAASGEDLASVGTIVADAITTFGLSASESTRVADLLTQAANSGTIGINDLAESFKYIGPVANTMGFSIEDVTTAVTALSTAGIKGSQAGTTLRTMFARLVKPTDAVAVAMDELGIKIADSEGNFYSMDEILRQMRGTFQSLTPEQQTYYATVLAGQEGMSGLTTLLSMTQEEYDKISESMQNATGVADETARVMQDNLAGSIEQLGGALESAGIIIGNQLIPYIQALADWIASLVEKFNNLDPSVQAFVTRVALVAAAVGPVMLVLSKLIGLVRTVPGVIMTIGTTVAQIIPAFSLLKAGADMGQLAMEGFSNKTLGIVSALSGISAPVVAAVAVIGTLVAAFKTLWDTSEEFRNSITKTFRDIVKSVQEFADGIVSRVNELGFDFSGVTDMIRSAWIGLCNILAPLFTGAFDSIAVALQTVFDVILGVLDVFIGVFTGDWQQAADGVIEIVGGLFDGITELSANVLETFGGIASQILSALGLEEAAQAVSDFFSNLAEMFSQLPETLLSVGEAIGNFFTVTLPGFFQSAVTTIENVVTQIINFFTVTIPEAFTNFVTVTVPNFINSFVIWLQQLPYNLGVMVGQFLGQIVVFGQDLLSWVASTIPVVINNIVNFFSQLPGKIWMFLQNIINRVIQWGQRILNDGTNAARNFLNSVVSFIQQLPGRIASFLSNIISNVASWGSDMVSRAGSTASNFVNNMVNTIKNLPNRIYSIITQIPGKVTQIGSRMLQAGKHILNKLWDGIKSVGDSVLGWVSDFAGSIASFVSGIVDGFSSVVYSANNARSAAQSVNGSHADGLAYVPFDGYIAELHQGERVLTADENRAYNSGKAVGGNGGDTFNFYNTKPNPYEYARQMKKAKRELLYGL